MVDEDCVTYCNCVRYEIIKTFLNFFLAKVFYL